MVLRSQDSVLRHNVRVRELDAKLREMFEGDNIKIDDFLKTVVHRWYFAFLGFFVSG